MLAILNVSRFAIPFFFVHIITMVQLALAFVISALVSVQASPLLEKRIAQTISASMTKWEAACVRYDTFYILQLFPNAFLSLSLSLRIRRAIIVHSAMFLPSRLSAPYSQLPVPVLNKMLQTLLLTSPNSKTVRR